MPHPWRNPAFIRSVTPCNLCGSHEAFVIGDRDRDGSPLRTVISAKSGLVWTDPRPSSAEIDAFYGQLYRVSYKGAFEPKPKHVYRAGLLARERIARLSRFLSEARRTLDVGAGGGEFVRHMLDHGKEAVGLEPNEGYARWARETLGLDVRCGHWRFADFGPGSFDAVTLFHVLEHLEDPISALVQFREWLSANGVLVIEVPNLESQGGSPSRRFHFAHLYSFNAEALEMLGRKAGFSVLQTEISRDGGNLTVVFRKREVPESLSGEIQGNCARIMTIMRSLTPLRYAISPGTWAKPFQKLAHVVWEWLTVRCHRAPKELLESTLQGPKNGQRRF